MAILVTGGGPDFAANINAVSEIGRWMDLVSFETGVLHSQHTVHIG